MPPCDAGTGGRTAGPDAGAAVHPATCTFTLPAELAAPWAARNRIRDWMERLGMPEALVEDLEYLVSEAVSNAAEHAYPPEVVGGTIEVHADLLDAADGTQVRVNVRDHGRWQPVDPDPRSRGHGIAAMAALAQELTIRHGADGGTEIVILGPSFVRGVSK